MFGAPYQIISITLGGSTVRPVLYFAIYNARADTNMMNTPVFPEVP